MLDRYTHCLLGRSHLDLPEEEKRRIRLEKGESVDPNQEVFKLSTEPGKSGSEAVGVVVSKEHVHLTQAELHGIKFIIMYLHNLPTSKKKVPIMLPDPIAVVKDVRTLVLAHKDDCPDRAITGKCILRWSEQDDFKRPKKFLAKQVMEAMTKRTVGGSGGSHSSSTASTNKLFHKKFAAGNRRRRVRCKMCEACQGGDCKTCVYCKDMTKYGGPGRMKQTCEKVRSTYYLAEGIFVRTVHMRAVSGSTSFSALLTAAMSASATACVRLLLDMQVGRLVQ